MSINIAHLVGMKLLSRILQRTYGVNVPHLMYQASLPIRKTLFICFFKLQSCLR